MQFHFYCPPGIKSLWTCPKRSDLHRIVLKNSLLLYEANELSTYIHSIHDLSFEDESAIVTEYSVQQGCDRDDRHLMVNATGVISVPDV